MNTPDLPNTAGARPALDLAACSGSFQSLSPFSHPTAETSSRWHGNELIWTINGQDVTDKALRSWCYINLNYPWCYVDVVRQYHVNAWAARNSPNKPDEPARSNLASQTDGRA